MPGKEGQGEMESRSTDSSRATGATKRPGFRGRVDEKDRSPGRGGRETRKGLLGLFAHRWGGDGSAARYSRECMSYSARVVGLQDGRGIMNFSDEHAI